MAAYLRAIDDAEADNGMDALAKVRKMALYGCSRYFANRIARTVYNAMFDLSDDR